MATEAPEIAEPPQPEQPKNWLEQQLKLYSDLLLGHAGIATDRVQRNSERSYVLMDAAATGDLSKLSESDSKKGAEDMGVSVGNTQHYHYNYAKTETGVLPIALPSPPLWLKGLLAAGLIGGPLASALAVYTLLPDQPDAIVQPPPVIQPVDPNDFDFHVVPGIQPK